MKKININTVIEGAYPNTPQDISVCGIETVLYIPENARILRIKDEKYIFHGTTSDFSEFRVAQSPVFIGKSGYDKIKRISGGLDMKEQFPKINWIFDAQRSLLTLDGRLYVAAIYFHEQWRWYLDRVPEILYKAKKIFDAQSNKVER
jgi:hypothetical protein